MEIKQHAPEQLFGSKKKSKGKSKTYLETNENGNTTYQNFWDAIKSCSKREFYSDKYQNEEKRNITNKQPNFTPQGTGKGGTK